MHQWRFNLYFVWFTQIISLTSFGFGMPFLPFYLQELGVTDPDQLKLYIGIVGAAPAISMGIMGPVWGMLSDRWGKKLMLLRSMFFATFVLAGLGLATQPMHLIILRFAQGLFTGTTTASSTLIASSTPSNRLSYSLGFLSSSTFIGFSAGPAIGGFVAESVGYRVSFFIGSALMLIAFLLVLFAVKENTSRSIHKEASSGKNLSIKQILTPILAILLIILFFMRITRTVFNPYLPLYVQELYTKTEGTVRITGIISAIAGLATAASGITLSRLGDRYDKKKLLVLFLSVGIALSIPLVLANNLWLFAFMLGVFFFAVGGVEPIVMSYTSENIIPERRGLLFGIQTLVGSIGWAVSPMLGSIVSIRFSVRAIFILLPIILIFALIAALKLIQNNSSKPVEKGTDKTVPI